MEGKTLIFTLILALVYIVLRTLTFRIYQTIGKRKDFDPDRIYASSKATVNIISIIFVIIFLSVWGIGFKGIHVYLSSIFAVIGVAFFATWSVLSSITSGIIIYFSFDLRTGDNVRIIDGENTVEGKIIEFGLYAIRIRGTKENHVVIYPNNLAVQKAIEKL